MIQVQGKDYVLDLNAINEYFTTYIEDGKDKEIINTYQYQNEGTEMNNDNPLYNKQQREYTASLRDKEMNIRYDFLHTLFATLDKAPANPVKGIAYTMDSALAFNTLLANKFITIKSAAKESNNKK